MSTSVFVLTHKDAKIIRRAANDPLNPSPTKDVVWEKAASADLVTQSEVPVDVATLGVHLPKCHDGCVLSS